MLTEAQVAALEKAKAEKEAHGEFESECPGYCGAQDTFYVGTLEGRRARLPADLHRHLRQGGFAKLYDRKTPITAADLLNDRVMPFFDEHDIRLQRVLTDRGTEYCGNPSATNTSSTWRSRTSTTPAPRPRARRPTASVERFHKTVLDEFYRVAFRKKIYAAIDELQADLDRLDRRVQRAPGHIRAAGASARPRCRPSLTPPARARKINPRSLRPSTAA